MGCAMPLSGVTSGRFLMVNRGHGSLLRGDGRDRLSPYEGLFRTQARRICLWLERHDSKSHAVRCPSVIAFY